MNNDLQQSFKNLPKTAIVRTYTAEIFATHGFDIAPYRRGV